MVIVYSIAWAFAKKLPQDGTYQFNCRQSLALMLLIIIMGRLLGTYAKINYDINNSNLFSIILIYDVLLSIALLSMQLLQRQEEKYRMHSALQEQLRLLQKNQFELFQANITTINHKCHDLKHILVAMETSGCYDQKLLQELKQDIMIYDSKMDTGNEVLDTILAKAWMDCYHKQVQWTCLADGKALQFMEATDLFIMLGNALDNAIESASQISLQQQRFLSVNIWKQEKMVFIKIENYCHQVPTFKDGVPLTTKKDLTNHGFGMLSIQNVVSKYHGKLKIDINDNIFILNIMFLNN